MLFYLLEYGEEESILCEWNRRSSRS